MSSPRPTFVVVGIGNGTGTGAASARVFARAGYRVVLTSRNPDHLKKVADEINDSGGEAAAFPITSYTYSEILGVYESIKSHQWPTAGKTEIRAALFNAAGGVWKSFLDVTEEDIQNALSANIASAFAFSRASILAFKENEIDQAGSRGTLIFTGAPNSIRALVNVSVVTAGKFGLRALSQSLAKEFGKENIHVAHALIDGSINSDNPVVKGSGDRLANHKENTANIRLNPQSIAESYLFLANQHRSAWTWELDLRPAHEQWKSEAI